MAAVSLSVVRGDVPGSKPSIPISHPLKAEPKYKLVPKFSNELLLEGRYYMNIAPWYTGLTANIHLGRDARTGELRVIKRLFQESDYCYETYIIVVLSKTILPHSVRILHCSPSSGKVRNIHQTADSEFTNTLVMEHIPAENLYTICHQQKKVLSCFECVSILRQLLEYTQNCHAADVLHGDLKLSNLLWETLSRHLRVIDNGGSYKFSDLRKLLPIITTIWYRAPEVFLGYPYSQGTDTWSIGAIYYELMTGEPIFPFATGDFKLLEDQAQIEGMTVLQLGLPTPEFLQSCTKAGCFFFALDGRVFPKITGKMNKLRPWTKIFEEGAKKRGLSEENILESIRLLKAIFVWDPKKRPSIQEILSSKLFDLDMRFTCAPSKECTVRFYDKQSQKDVLLVEHDNLHRSCVHLPNRPGMSVEFIDKNRAYIPLNTANLQFHEGSHLDCDVVLKDRLEEKSEKKENQLL